MKLLVVVLALSASCLAADCSWHTGRVVAFENHGWKSGGYSEITVSGDDGTLFRGEHAMRSAFSNQAHFTENDAIEWCADTKHLRVRVGKSSQSFNLVSKRLHDARNQVRQP